MRYLMKISYDGSKFYGFQRLNDLRTVQKELEQALTMINKKDVFIKGAGRTDRGVHALGQGVSFDLDIKISADGLKKAVNALVKPDIYCRECMIVDDDFHARFSVKKKRYRYKINLGEFNPLNDDYFYQPIFALDIEKMQEVAKLFLGIHDFKNFVSGERKNTQCIIYSIDFEKHNDDLEIIFEGKSFYRYMVRNLVGAMIEVGRGKVKIDVVKDILDLKQDKTLFTAPACGLYLEKVIY